MLQCRFAEGGAGHMSNFANLSASRPQANDALFECCDTLLFPVDLQHGNEILAFGERSKHPHDVHPRRTLFTLLGKCSRRSIVSKSSCSSSGTSS